MTTTHPITKITDPRTRYAALVAIETAIAKMRRRAKADVLRAEEVSGIPLDLPAPLGVVNVTHTAPAPKIDGARLIAWALEHRPDIIEQVAQLTREGSEEVRADLAIIAGQVVFASTGEPAPFADVAPEGPAVVSYPNSDARRYTVEWATVMMEDEHGENLIAELVELAVREATKR